MKKFTLLLFWMLCASLGYGQCNNTTMYPSDPVVSNNLGIPQEITTCAYTEEFSTITNVAVGEDYVFTCVSNDAPADKYITVTDLSNATIAHGPSPLTVTAISAASIRLHYTEDANCVTDDVCHTITMQVLLDCPLPTDILITGITPTNASFAWTPGGTETAWQVLVLTEADAAPTAATSGTPITDNPVHSVTNLTAASPYSFYVRSNCGSEFSPWNGPFEFTSGCNPVAVYNENFDTTDYGDLPICWTGVLTGANEFAYVQTVDYNSFSGENAVEIYNSDSSASANIMLVGPNVSTLQAATHRLKFFARSGYDPMQLEVGTVDAVTADGTFNMIQQVSITNSYGEYAVDFTGYTGTDTFVAIRHPNTSTYMSAYVDNIRWEVAPLCPDVTEIEASAVTTTAATINWLPGGSETQWDVVYGPESATDPNLLTPIAPAPSGTPQAILSGLTDNTSYNVWVRSACGSPNGNGAWIGPMHFTTACLPISTFSENFDSTDYGDLPDCWSAILTGTDVSNNAYVQVVDYNSVSGENSVEIYNSDSAADSNIILVSPNLGTSVGAGTHRIKFYVRSGDDTGSIEVGTLDGNTESSNFTAYQTIATTSTQTEYVVDFTGFTGTDTYVGIRHNSGTYTSFYVDNMRWEVAPLCPDVSEITITNTTTNSASLTWYANGSETQWDVVYGAESVTDPSTLTPISPAPSSNPEATLTGLTDNTTYNLWVRSACGGTAGNGVWIGPITFTTACFATGLLNENFDTTDTGDLPDCWTAVFAGPTVSQYAEIETVDYNAYSGDNSVMIQNADSAPTDFVMLVSPNLNTLATATHRLKFYAFRYEWNNGAILDIGTMDGNTSNATFTSYQQVTVTDDYTEYAVNFTAYSGTDTYVAIRNISGEYISIFLDDIRWEVAPLCADVVDLELSQITTNSATLTWGPGGSETSWQVAYGPVSVTDPSTLTPSDPLPNPTFPLSGLTPNTSYNVWVRSACGSPNGNGAWIGPIVLTTQCLPTTLPFLLYFENAVTPNLPECSSAINLSNGNDWGTNTVNDYGFNSTVLQYLYNSGNAADAWFFTQGIILTGGTNYDITYTYGSNSTFYVENMKIMYGTSADLDGMTEDIADHTFSFDVAETNTVTFSPVTSGTYYFGFNVYSIANQYNVFVDNISIDVNLQTPDTDISKFSYYPNPVTDILNLSHTAAISNIAVFNLVGQLVLESNPNHTTTQVDMSGLSSGTYLVKVTADNATKTVKVIKQ